MDYMEYLTYDSGDSDYDQLPTENGPIYILGKCYNNPKQEMEVIRGDIQSKIWCTYRRGFVPIGSPQLTSDKGWGCMLRCGQMVLAQALVALHLGRDWIWTRETRDPTYLKIIEMFEDNRKSPFSIHQIALMGNSEDKKVGEWFGPNTIAQVLKKLVKYDDWGSIDIHVALDNVVVTEEILELCEVEKQIWKPVLLIIPLRLGLTDINPIYIPGLKKCFELPGNVGMIGGRPNQALYFIGYVENEALFLDPHTAQRCGSVGNKSNEEEIEMDETFHQRFVNRIDFKHMDPSLAVCFLCTNRQEFDALIERFQRELIDSDIQPLFEVSKRRPQEWQSYHSSIDGSEKATNAEFENLEPNPSDDEFEIIV
ncbi:cysteine protease ATG4A isoform X2 [Culicoides brevitarsis]|uniref:cysteine protease ATG4A isoform X2 n=1 Tax=Culicoides brevitarsis TaxID=469753 RepID=UPI00307B1416